MANKMTVYSKAILIHMKEVHNIEISNIDELKPDTLASLMAYTPAELCYPYMARRFKTGASIRAITQATGLSFSNVRSYGKRIGFLSR
jgi:hypothetical protein